MRWVQFACAIALATGLNACKAPVAVDEPDVGAAADVQTDGAVAPDAPDVAKTDADVAATDADGTAGTDATAADAPQADAESDADATEADVPPVDAQDGPDAADANVSQIDEQTGTDASDADATAPTDDAATGTDALDAAEEIWAPDAATDAVADVEPIDAANEDAAQVDVAPDAEVPDADAQADVAGADIAVDPCANLSCDDGNACTADSCAPASGCVHLATAATCSDGNACTFSDACQTGACLPGTATSCDDGNVCTTDACDPTDGCTFLANAATCTDENACTLGDSCTDSACTAVAISCDDGDACTVDSCDKIVGCKHVFTASSAPEVCNGVDDNCDGQTDENLGTTTCGLGACVSTVNNCVAGVPQNCVPGTPQNETCNGVDDNCNGVIDDNPSDVGGTCGVNCPGGLAANCTGGCSAGTVVCSADGTKTCVGSTGPAVEVCNDKDDDCDGIVDDNLSDAWKAQACCPTGTLGDCQNSGGGTRCSTGTFQCSAGAKVCFGGVAKSTETCNGVDDDCNGSVDDVAQLGDACTGGGTITNGACTASFTCSGSPGPGPNGLTCSQIVGPKAETCNGIDDNCNGVIDDNPSDAGGACGSNCPGGLVANCQGACTKGTLVCAAGGTKVCVGSNGPSVEVCNSLDDDCDGIVDDNLTDAWKAQACCTTGTLGDCQNSGSGTRCGTGTFHCWAGTQVCLGSVAKATEVCNSVDDDCNGSVDNVAQLGNACTGGGTNTIGACTANFTCGGSPGPGPNGLTCSQVVGPKAETCNGIDDNCNGMIDDSPSDVGGACGASCPGGLVANCVGRCTAGTLVCANGGTKTCIGSIGPAAEICNGVDDDCNGVIDDNVSCDDGNTCTLDACKAGGCVNNSLGDGVTCGSGKYCVATTCTALSVPTGMALIPAATFWMGCNGVKDNNCQADNLPQHKVTLSAYYMDLTETTVAQYKACVDAGVCTQPNYVQPANFATYPGLTSNPVNFVSWAQARQYCTWRGAGYDLPTEAQSEMATRGSCEQNGSAANDIGCLSAMRTNPWGETAATCAYAILWDSSGEGCGTSATWPVGSVPAGDSPYGLHDLAGNVREWNLDWHAAYTSDAQINPVGPGTGTYHSVRDGSLGEGALNQRSANRSYSSGNPVWDIGLRCARSYP